MNEVLRLDANDDQVWARTLAAVEASAKVSPISVRCRQDGCRLASVGMTELGPMFTSTWLSEIEPRFQVNRDGQDLGRRAAIRAFHGAGQLVSGVRRTPSDYLEQHGVIALLVLPQDMVQDFPDLLVRCDHGDAVVDRTDALGWLRRGRAPKVAVSMPRREYEPQRSDFGSTASAQPRDPEVRRIGAAKDRTLTPDQVLEVLRGMGHNL